MIVTIPPPRATLFPYTTLFRSRLAEQLVVTGHAVQRVGPDIAADDIGDGVARAGHGAVAQEQILDRSEEHTSELQSQSNLVCRLLLEKKKNKPSNPCF